ncbi:MAG: V-type ATP synthase subunit D, partial [Bacillota bacterium]|nr:V-type ATP synthase subunit D [Bacillota bacterium]
YGFFRTNPAFDKAVLNFSDIRKLIYDLAEIENSVYKLAMEIKKTQKRANALDKIQIPKYTTTIKYIEEVLEEKEREDFFRLKKVKGK